MFYCISKKNITTCYAYPVFSQIVSYHALLPHLLGSLGSFRKPWFLFTVSLVFCQHPLIQLRVATPILHNNMVTQDIAQEQNSMLMYKHTFTDGDLALRGLPIPASLLPPSFSSDNTRSLSSSGRLCRNKEIQANSSNKQRLSVGRTSLPQ